MLTKRIIPCLDIKNGRTVKGVNFINLIDAGDPVVLAKQYAALGADELVFLDITATVERRKTLAELVREIALEINIPFTVGGGINSVEAVGEIVQAGADKVSINSAAIKNPNLIHQRLIVLCRQYPANRISTGVFGRSLCRFQVQAPLWIAAGSWQKIPAGAGHCTQRCIWLAVECR